MEKRQMDGQRKKKKHEMDGEGWREIDKKETRERLIHKR